MPDSNESLAPENGDKKRFSLYATRQQESKYLFFVQEIGFANNLVTPWKNVQPNPLNRPPQFLCPPLNIMSVH